MDVVFNYTKQHPQRVEDTLTLVERKRSTYKKFQQRNVPNPFRPTPQRGFEEEGVMRMHRDLEDGVR